MKRRCTQLAVSAGLAVCLAACNTKTIYDSFEHIDTNGWERGDTLCFTIPSLESAGTYTEQVGLRTTGLYPFMSLTLIVEQTIFPLGKTLSDTIVCHLTNANGTSLGRGISTFQYDFDVRVLNLYKADSISVSIHHHMRREVLPGIVDVGFQVSKE